MNIFAKIFGSKNAKQLKKIEPFIKSINRLEEKFSKLSDSELKELREEFIQKHEKGESLDNLLSEAFAATREVAKRKLNLRHFDCQLLGGIALHNCQIAEMATGEGKTLVATLPAYLNSFTERKVVLVTVNDYLAKRDAEWMKPIYEGLGMKVSFVVSGQSMEERKSAYEADVIYATLVYFLWTGWSYIMVKVTLKPSKGETSAHASLNSTLTFSLIRINFLGFCCSSIPAD